MYLLWESVIEPFLRAVGARVVVEVGAEEGYLTAPLLEYCDAHDGVAHVIEPQAHFLPESWKERYGRRFVLHEDVSLNALPRIEDPDVVLLDGDHNWYTVYHELGAIENLRQDGRFPVVVLHDIGWPYGRRDMYYDPSVVPERFRHRSRARGMRPGRSELLEEGGFNPHLENAEREGGPRNGVRTALEDFIAESRHDLRLTEVSGLHGLGVVVARQQLAASRELARAVERLTSAEFLLEHLERVERYWLEYVS